MKQKPYWKMTAKELARATKEFDGEIPAGTAKPRTAEERQRWERVRKAPTRSIYILDDHPSRQGAVLLELGSDLVRELDARASERRLTRSKLVERELRSALGLSKARNGSRKHRRSA